MRRTVGRGEQATAQGAHIERQNDFTSLRVQERQALWKNKAIEAEKAGRPKLDMICRNTMASGEPNVGCLKGQNCSKYPECIEKWARRYYKPKFKRGIKPKFRRTK